MSDAEDFQGPEAPYTITLKGGAGFEAPWLVLRATSAADAVALLGEAVVAELPEKIAEFAGDFRAKNGAAPAGAGARTTGSPSRSGAPRGGQSTQRRGAAPQSQQQSQSQSAPAGDTEFHPEGVTCSVDGEVVVYKEINSRGKKYELWVCPNQRSKGDGHFSEFIN